eukprot:snap_masked-scaffold_56-processed-gene-1.53-mRNA-1 protein AED:1.00 eAED:1.00 QI:0/-1/0/0/-1/1/1/0/107
MSKTLSKMSREFKKLISKQEHYNFELEEEDLDLIKILKSLRQNHISEARNIVDYEFTAIQKPPKLNPVPSPQVKPIYYWEAIALLGEGSTSPNNPARLQTKKSLTKP